MLLNDYTCEKEVWLISNEFCQSISRQLIFSLSAVFQLERSFIQSQLFGLSANVW